MGRSPIGQKKRPIYVDVPRTGLRLQYKSPLQKKKNQRPRWQKKKKHIVPPPGLEDLAHYPLLPSQGVIKKMSGIYLYNKNAHRNSKVKNKNGWPVGKLVHPGSVVVTGG